MKAGESGDVAQLATPTETGLLMKMPNEEVMLGRVRPQRRTAVFIVNPIDC